MTRAAQAMSAGLHQAAALGYLSRLATDVLKMSLHGALARWDLPDCLLATVPQQGFGTLNESFVAVDSAQPLQVAPLDLILLRSGVRPACLLHGPEKWVAGVCRWAEARRLCALPSAWEFVPLRDDRLGTYANLSANRRPATGNAGVWRAVAVSASPSLAALIWLAESRGWDGTLGRALGYPDCCCTAFEIAWPLAVADGSGDPAFMSVACSRFPIRIPWQINVFARYSGPVLTDHFPCSWSCVATIAQAEQVAAALLHWSPATLAEIETRMRRDMMLRNGCVVPGVPQDGSFVTLYPEPSLMKVEGVD